MKPIGIKLKTLNRKPKAALLTIPLDIIQQDVEAIQYNLSYRFLCVVPYDQVAQFSPYLKIERAHNETMDDLSFSKVERALTIITQVIMENVELHRETL